MIGNSLRWELNAFVGFIERQKNLYRRYWLWEAVWLLYNLVSVLSIGYLAAGLSTLGLEQGQADLHQTQLYLLVGALLWTYLSLVFFEIAFAITWERWEGTIEYTFMAPIKRLTHLLGMSAASLIYGIARTAASLLTFLTVPLIDGARRTIVGIAPATSMSRVYLSWPVTIARASLREVGVPTSVCADSAFGVALRFGRLARAAGPAKEP